MRWCSRSTAGDISATSAGFAGSGSAACGARDGGEAVQAASTSAAAAMPAWASRSLAVPMNRQMVTAHHPSLAVSDLYLLRARCLDPRPAALLDPSTHPHTPAREILRVETRRREVTRISLQDRNSEVLGQPPPEVHVNRGSAFAHR